jgi:hypothetical protein
MYTREEEEVKKEAVRRGTRPVENRKFTGNSSQSKVKVESSRAEKASSCRLQRPAEERE